MVRPQPGHAVTIGVNARRPMVCSSSCATTTSCVRGAPGSGVSEMRIVSPMPSCSSTASAALEATMPLLPMPASVRPRCRAKSRTRGQVAIHGDQFLHATDLARQHDAIGRQAEFDRAMRRVERRQDQRLAQHARRLPWLGAQVVFVHQPGRQRLVERAPVDADPHRLAVSDRELDHLRELRIALLAETDVAGIDPVLRQRFGAGRFVREQLVAVVVEVADDRHLDAHHRQPVDDLRHRARGFRGVDRDPHQFGTGAPQFGDLLDRRR